MGNILSFENSRRQINQEMASSGISFKEVAGYNILLPSIIEGFWKSVRGIGKDFMIMKLYTLRGETIKLMKGGYPPSEMGELVDLRKNAEKLEQKLDDDADAALDQLLANPYASCRWHEDGFATIYVACENGVIGCGWHDSTGTRKKATLLAAFMLFAMGMINEDKKLQDSVLSCLPYDSSMYDASAFDEAEDIVYEGVYNECLKKLQQ